LIQKLYSKQRIYADVNESARKWRINMRFLMASVVIATALLSSMASAQDSPAPTGVPVSLVVTVEPHRGSTVPMIDERDVMPYVKHERAKVTGWVPLKDAKAGVQLFLLIDDSSSTDLGSQLGDLRQFILSQPQTTEIGVAYMQNGTAQILQNLTSDHGAAAKVLRLPIGAAAASASPYFSLGDLIKRWPEAKVPREVLMVTDGIDRYWGSAPNDPYVDSTIEQAQKAGVVVFAIYMPGVGHYGHSFWRMNWGQNYLSQVADETGGEAFYLGNGAPVSFRPYLEDLGNRLGRQYWLTFLAPPEKKAGLQQVKIETEVPKVDLVSADRVYVPAGQ
jgi:hypothetical protein